MKPLFILIPLLYFAGNFYVFYRIYALFPPNIWLKWLVFGVGFLLVLSFFLGMTAAFLPDVFPKSLVSVCYIVGTSWMMIMMYLALFFIFFDLLKILTFFPLKPIVFQIINYARYSGLLILLGVFLFGYWKYYQKEKVILKLDTPKLETSFKIVAISDLHLGFGIGKSELEDWVKLINAEKPDIVLIAGDIVDNSIVPLLEQNMAESFRKINSKFGVYTVLGNHEYIAGKEKLQQFFDDANINLLCDSSVLIDNQLYIIGRDDVMNRKRKSVKQLVENLAIEKAKILITHQPFHLEESEQNGIDFQFSGHTHKGQLFPINLITKRMFEKDYGYLQKGQTHYFISSGIGVWGGKFRIGSRSEYVVIEITNLERDFSLRSK